MNTASLSPEALVDALRVENLSTISTETSRTTGCPICNSWEEANTAKSHSRNWSISEKKCVVCGNNCGRPSLLDLFCGAGGAARGYQLAGFCVLGIDNQPQKHYAGCRFHQGDALEYLAAHGREFDVVHASPPCQAYSCLRKFSNGTHPKLVDAVRKALVATGKTYVIENVPGAPVRNPIMLCGTMFDGLGVKRHRLFESNVAIVATGPCDHSVKRNPLRYKTLRHGKWYMSRFCPVYGGGGGKGAPGTKDWGPAMGIDWMASRKEISQAIPPAYTTFIGKQLIQVLRANP